MSKAEPATSAVALAAERDTWYENAIAWREQAIESEARAMYYADAYAKTDIAGQEFAPEAAKGQKWGRFAPHFAVWIDLTEGEQDRYRKLAARKLGGVRR